MKSMLTFHLRVKSAIEIAAMCIGNWVHNYCIVNFIQWYLIIWRYSRYKQIHIINKIGSDRIMRSWSLCHLIGVWRWRQFVNWKPSNIANSKTDTRNKQMNEWQREKSKYSYKWLQNQYSDYQASSAYCTVWQAASSDNTSSRLLQFLPLFVCSCFSPLNLVASFFVQQVISKFVVGILQ